jgi:ABC-type Fe3+-citrate transport system substrate-binding protein
MFRLKTISPKEEAFRSRQFMPFSAEQGEGSANPHSNYIISLTQHLMCIHLSFVSECCKTKIMLSNLLIFVSQAKYIFTIMRYKKKKFSHKIQESGLWQLLKSEANDSVLCSDSNFCWIKKRRSRLAEQFFINFYDALTKDPLR